MGMMSFTLTLGVEHLVRVNLHTELAGVDGDPSVTYRVKSIDPNEPEQDWVLVLNEDGSGDAYYSYYADSSDPTGYGTKFLSFTNIERVEFNDVHQTLERGPENLRWAGFDLEGTGNGVHIAQPELDYIMITGTSGNDAIDVYDELVSMGYDPNDRDLEIVIEDAGGNDSYDFTDFAGHADIIDGEGDDDYFTTGGNDNDLQVEDFGYGSNTYDLPHEGSINVDFDLWEMNLDADDVWVDGAQLSPQSPTQTNPIKGYITDQSGNDDLMMEVYFSSAGDFVVKSYDYDDTGTKFSTLSTFEDLRDWKAFEIDLNGSNNWGNIEGEIDFEDQTLTYIQSVRGVNNPVTGTEDDDYFFDGRGNEIFTLLGGDDYVELWEGGDDTVNLGAGNDVIWPDGWYYQDADDGDPISYDVIDGADGIDVIHIDTWGGTPRTGEFTITELAGVDGDTTVTYRVKSIDPNEPEQDWVLVLNEDGSGDAYYSYYADSSDPTGYGTKFLSFTNIERVEFNSLDQTIERGADNLRWAGFDLKGTGNGVHSISARDDGLLVEHEATFGNSTYKLVLGYYDFDEAAQLASSMGGHILEIGSDAENTFILEEFLSYGSTSTEEVLLGITDREYEGIWLTHDGKLIEYDDFPQWQPDDWETGQDYAHRI